MKPESTNKNVGSKQGWVGCDLRKFTALVLPALIHTTCGILLAYVVTNGLVRFSKYESRALTKLQKTSEADFFAITLCPDYKQAYNSEKLKMLGLKKNGYIRELHREL